MKSGLINHTSYPLQKLHIVHGGFRGSHQKTFFYGVSGAHNSLQKMKFSIKDFFSKCDQIRRKLINQHWMNQIHFDLSFFLEFIRSAISLVFFKYMNCDNVPIFAIVFS